MEYEGQSESTSLLHGHLPADAPEVLADPGHSRLRNVIFEDVDLHVMGGHPKEERLNMLDPSIGSLELRDADHPEGGSRVSAYGYDIRHADGVHFKNCTISTEIYDARAPFHTFDCTDVTFENISIRNPGKIQ